MYGAILGDIIGQPYEFDRGKKTKDFPLFCNTPRFTDDSVMTIAVCDGILNAGLTADEKIMKEYKNRSIIIGKTVTVLNNSTYTARVIDITDDAHLVVEGEHGKEELFTGDVSIRL